MARISNTKLEIVSIDIKPNQADLFGEEVLVKIKVDKDCPKEVINACPRGLLKSEGGKVTVIDENKCDMCEECIEMCRKLGKKSIELTPTEELVITVESFGQIDEEDIFKRAIEILKEDLKEAGKKLK